VNFAQACSEERSPHETERDEVTVEANFRLHTCEDFDFVANAPAERVFPLFGAEMERAWAEDWNPRFVWPAKAEDRNGMVFQLAHGDRTAIWVNTLFDREARRVQYVYVLPDRVATLITLKLTPRGDSTHVTVRYERTSLSAEADAMVREMAELDRRAGAEWATQINRYLTDATQRTKQ
jgi:hypothetical protein